MVYDLSKNIDVERITRRITQLINNKRVVELTEKTFRTRAQNSYLHLILNYFALEYGEPMEYIKQKYFKGIVNKDIFLDVKEDQFLGNIDIYKSTADISKENMIIAIERFKMWSAKTVGIILPDPDNLEFIQEIEIEIEKNKKYL